MNFLGNKTYSKTGNKLKILHGMKNDISKGKLSPKYNITEKVQKWLKIRKKLKKRKEPFKVQIGHMFYEEIGKINKRAPPVCTYNLKPVKNKRTSVNYNTLSKNKNTFKKLKQRKKRIQSCKIFCTRTENNLRENKENFNNNLNTKNCIKKSKVKKSSYSNNKKLGYIKFDMYEERKSKQKISYVDYDLNPNKIKIRSPKNIIFSNSRHKALKKNKFQNNYFNYNPKSIFSNVKNAPVFDLMTGRDSFNSFYKFTNLNPFYYNPKIQKKKIRTPLFDKTSKKK